MINGFKIRCVSKNTGGTCYLKDNNRELFISRVIAEQKVSNLKNNPPLFDNFEYQIEEAIVNE